MIRRLAAVSLLFVLALVVGARFWRSARASCDRPGNPPICCPNVIWSLRDSVTACPAGDSVFAGRPSRLRITLYYNDNDCNGRAGVPPESICVQVHTQSGNLKVNDEGAKIFADDSTDTGGFARITIPSFSGCGTLSVTVFVSNSSFGTKVAKVRTTDSNADGRTQDPEDLPACDLNYDGFAGTIGDRNILEPHVSHWHRNALFGTLARRTNLCETCRPESTGTIGDSEIFWSPDGKRLAFTVHSGPAAPPGDTVASCMVFLARSNPREGNALTQFTFPDSLLHDYDPSWSPLGDVIAFDRDDRRILRKGITGVNPDTNLYLVAASGDGDNPGDATPGISPDGQWVAFSRRDGGPRHVWKVPITGGTPTRLTSETDGVDFYPQWSSDGNWIIFDRQIGQSDQPHHAYKVKWNGDSLQAVYDAPSGQDAATPAFSPDGVIVTLGQGSHVLVNPPRDVTTRTLDPALAVKKALAYYTDATFADKGPDPVLSPRISPDGTRPSLPTWVRHRPPGSLV